MVKITLIFPNFYCPIHAHAMHETIKEPQLPKHERGLDVTLRAALSVA